MTTSAGAWLARRAPFRLAATVVIAVLTWNTPVAAGPTSYTWTMSGSHGPLQYGNELEFSASEDSSRKLKVRSYSSANDGADFHDAYTDLFGGGIGVRNQFESGGSPNHAIDNSGHNDFVLFEFDSGDFTADSFKIGWRYRDSDIRIWVGGGVAGLDLTTACGGACAVVSLAGLGFTQLPDFWNVPVNTSTDLDTSLTGRYMIVAGGDESYKEDHFKLKQIVAQEQEQDRGHDVPEPSTLALFGVGVALAGFTYLRRRRAA